MRVMMEKDGLIWRAVGVQEADEIAQRNGLPGAERLVDAMKGKTFFVESSGQIKRGGVDL